MKTKLIALLLMFVCYHIGTQAQQSFPYPALPDSLRSVEQRASYLSGHYWDNYNFSDTLLLQSEEVTEQGFVNFIDILARFTPSIALQGVSAFTQKAFSNIDAKDRFESLIEHYFENPQSPLRNDRIYLLFLQEMKSSPYFDEAEKERLAFKIKNTDKNLPGDIAINFNFTGMGKGMEKRKGATKVNRKETEKQQLSDYKDQKVILYFYDPECENCHRISTWLKKQTIPAEYTWLRIVADNTISRLYSLKAMPTIYLLDKGNKVILKDCTAQQLMEWVSDKH